MSKRVDWYFSENPQGEDQGFADAGQETFRETLYDSVARETIQNSLDAWVDHSTPVRVTFECKAVPVADLLGASSLRAAIRRCRVFWATDKKAVAFFSNAEELLKRRKVDVLQVEDFNSTGLEGSDGERGSNWYSLTRAIGASSKQSGEGGSFGIGASAPFAASQLRTVYYSTVTQNERFGFLGIARLTTHKNPAGVQVNPNGKLGVDEGRRVGDRGLVPKPFRRTQLGTTVSIVGFKKTDTWESEFKVAVLEHFWPAIHLSRLVVTIGKTKIDSATLEKNLRWAAEEHGSHAIEYWRSLADVDDDGVFDHSDKLKHIGEVRLHLRIGGILIGTGLAATPK